MNSDGKPESGGSAPAPFSAEFQVAWADLDLNGHLSNSSYLDYAVQTRFLYLASRGFGPAEFASHRIGPAVLNETITYRRELRFLDRFAVEYRTSGGNAGGSKFRVVNSFIGPDGELCAELTSFGVWFDLGSRKTTPPPDGLAQAMAALVRTDDYEALD